MRKAKYDCRQVVCKNASGLGFSSNVAKPGYWIVFKDSGRQQCTGRVLGRIASVEYDGGLDCTGWLAVVRLYPSATFAGVAWVNPEDVSECYTQTPANLLQWIAGDEWVKSKADIARIVAMGAHGTLADRYIENRHDASAPYNARPEYVAQFILE